MPTLITLPPLANHPYLYQPPARPGGAHLLLLHGTGGSESDLLPLAEQVAPAWGYLSPRGLVQEKGMNRFFRRLAEGVFDLEDLARRTDDLADFVEQARERHDIQGPLYALGYSNGANIAGSLLLRRSEALAGAVLLRPMVPFEPEELPRLAGKAILILSGSMDPICPPAHAEILRHMFASAGATVDLQRLPASHGLTREDTLRAKQWLERL